MTSRLLFALLLAATGTAAPADDHAAMNHGAPKPKLSLNGAFDAQGRLWFAAVDGEHVVVRRSDDEGRTFDAPRVVNATAESIESGNEAGPKIAFGKRGEIYLSWTHTLTKPYTGLVRFSRSLDGGATFDAPVTVHRDTSEITHAFDALGVDGDGRVFVAWIDKRGREAAKAAGEEYVASAVWYAWSTDRGATFAPERKLADHTCECCRLSMARTPRGGMALLWRQVFDDGLRDHAWAELTADDKPATIRRASYENWKLDGCPHHGPSLAFARDGTAHAVWFSAADGNKVFYGQLQKAAAPAALREIAGAGASHADLGVDGRRVWVTWMQVGDEGQSVKLVMSTDGGKTFGEARTLATTEAAISQPHVLVHGGKAYALWRSAEGPQVTALGAGP